MVNIKQELINILAEGVVERAECECESGKDCPLCIALILLGQHAEWELRKNKLINRNTPNSIRFITDEE